MRSRRPILRLAARGVRALQPYLPGKPIEELEREYGVRDAVKLASNENPLGPPPAALEAAARVLGGIGLYPDGSGHRLRHALAARLGHPADGITLGNGSNDLLVLAAEAFLTPRAEAIYSEYAFAVYELAVRATGAGARVAGARPATAEQPRGHDLHAMRALVTPATRLVYIANPNNPTGTWNGAVELRAFLESLPHHVVVVLDEAYREYCTVADYPDTQPWLRDFPNLVITRTFSKVYGLAGLRVGYALSSAGLADVLNRVRQPFNVNSVALAAAEAALGDDAHVVRSRRINAAGLAQLREGLGALGLEVPPSAGNFVLATLDRPAGPVYDALLRRGVIVRPMGAYGLPGSLRITIGLPDQNERLLASLREALASPRGATP